MPRLIVRGFTISLGGYGGGLYHVSALEGDWERRTRESMDKE